MGPIQIMLLGFEDFNATGGIATELAALSDAGIIRVIDARFLLKDSPDGAIVVIDVHIERFDRAWVVVQDHRGVKFLLGQIAFMLGFGEVRGTI